MNMPTESTPGNAGMTMIVNAGISQVGLAKEQAKIIIDPAGLIIITTVRPETVIPGIIAGREIGRQHQAGVGSVRIILR